MGLRSSLMAERPLMKKLATSRSPVTIPAVLREGSNMLSSRAREAKSRRMANRERNGSISSPQFSEKDSLARLGTPMPSQAMMMMDISIFWYLCHCRDPMISLKKMQTDYQRSTLIKPTKRAIKIPEVNISKSIEIPVLLQPDQI